MFLQAEKRRTWFIPISLLGTIIGLMLLFHTISAQATVPTDFGGSQKTVDRAVALPGDIVKYDITLHNQGNSMAMFSLVDQLPASLSYQPGTLTATGSYPAILSGTNYISWTGYIPGNTAEKISFAATISNELSVNDLVVNTAVISSTGQIINRSATTKIVDQAVYLPILSRTLPTPSIQPISPTCGAVANSWLVVWEGTETNGTYELQEARDSDFTTPTSYFTSDISRFFHPAPGLNTTYYYRVRIVLGNVVGPWSNTASVVGTFFDNFANVNSGWANSETNISTVGYANGEYFIRTKDTGNPGVVFLAVSLSPDVHRSAYAVVADMHWQSGQSTEGLYGLVFGANENISKFYFAALFPDLQAYRIFFFDSTLPISDRLRPVSAFLTRDVIQKGTATNHLRVQRIGDDIRLEINNELVGSWTDGGQIGQTRSGLITVAINPEENPVVEARYDNFAIECTGAPSASTNRVDATAVTTQPPLILPEALFDNSK